MVASGQAIKALTLFWHYAATAASLESEKRRRRPDLCGLELLLQLAFATEHNLFLFLFTFFLSPARVSCCASLPNSRTGGMMMVLKVAIILSFYFANRKPQVYEAHWGLYFKLRAQACRVYVIYIFCNRRREISAWPRR